MAFVRVLNTLLRDKKIGKRVVPIVPDESRTFGMEGMFRQFGIFSRVGQLYTPEDAGQLMFYKEDKNGQLLQEGINELGAMSSWIAAATAYSTSDVPMIPFYIYYSMFGFQRVGDLAWAAGDLRARGFLLGGTAGRTTLNGEGLQHEDGHSHLFSAVIPNCVSYDPTFAYEVAVIVADGLRRMYAEQEDVFYYLTLMNENYHHPAMPEGVEEGIVKGLYLFREGDAGRHGSPEEPRQAEAASPAHGLGDDPARGDRRRRDARGRVGRRRRRVERAELHRAAPRRHGRRPLEHAPPHRDAPALLGRAVPGRPPGRAGGRGDATTCAPSPTRSGEWVGTGASPCSAPTASAARTTARRCATSSRSTGATWWSRPCPPWPATAPCPTEKVAEAIERYGIDPERPAPAHA